MDRRDTMTISGSPPFYMQSSFTQPSLNVSSGINTLSHINAPFQPNIVGANSMRSALLMEHPAAISVGELSTTMVSGQPEKRKRGRPRKYGADGAVSLALSPSLSTHPSTITPSQKRGRGRPPGTGKKQQLASRGEWLSGSAGMGFTPHVITIAVGEDIAMKIMSFSQQGPRAICILSANGAVSTVTLRQPATSGGTVTYEGRFEILCLSGSYLFSNNAGSHNQTGGLSVSLASPEGRVIGGGVGGVLIAASPVQVIAGSFLWGGPKTKNKKVEGPEVARDTDHQMVENPATPTSVQPSQNLSPASSIGAWPGSRSMDMSNTHVDIDLMRS